MNNWERACKIWPHINEGRGYFGDWVVEATGIKLYNHLDRKFKQRGNLVRLWTVTATCDGVTVQVQVRSIYPWTDKVTQTSAQALIYSALDSRMPKSHEDIRREQNNSKFNQTKEISQC